MYLTTIPIENIVKELIRGYTLCDSENIDIVTSDVNRPGLQLLILIILPQKESRYR